jgi:hypothetical protein
MNFVHVYARLRSVYCMIEGTDSTSMWAYSNFGEPATCPRLKLEFGISGPGGIGSKPPSSNSPMSNYPLDRCCSTSIRDWKKDLPVELP